jgi:hypothetical protein
MDDAFAFSLNAFARNTHGHARDRSNFSHRLASTCVRTVPFATAQERTDVLPLAFVTMNTIPAMERHCELAITPPFVNVVGNRPRHTRATCHFVSQKLTLFPSYDGQTLT